MRLASGTWRLQAAGGLSPPALPSSPAAARLAPAMPCVADWLNNPFSIVQGIFGERGPGGAGILSAATRPPGGRRDGGFSSREGGGTGASPHGVVAGRGREGLGEAGRAARAGGRFLLPRWERARRRVAEASEGVCGPRRRLGALSRSRARAARSTSVWQAG